MKLYVVDTNVPKTANLATIADQSSDVPSVCIKACVDTVSFVIENRSLVIDIGGEIFSEYMQQLSMKGAPGLGDKFMKWVNDIQWSLPENQRVNLKKQDGLYEDFPLHDGLRQFDKSDMKFVAVANAHAEKPAILQAVDCKWWGWKEALESCGISVEFLCPEYIEAKYREKMHSCE